MSYSEQDQKKNNMKKGNIDCDEIPQWVKSINENPDMLHLDYTPSVHALTDCGLNAIEAILPLLNSEDKWERRRAQRVLEGVVMQIYGWKSGQGFPEKSDGEEKVDKLFKKNGNYDAVNSKKERQLSIAKWDNWLKKQKLKDGKN